MRARRSKDFPAVFEGGEPKAHREIAAKYAVRFVCVAGSCRAPRSYGSCDPHRAFGAVFVVAGFGEASHGFEMNARQLREFRQRDQGCRFVTRMRHTWTDDSTGVVHSLVS